MSGNSLDWRDMFKRYSDVVSEAEGISFLYPLDWGAEEWEAIKEVTNGNVYSGKAGLE